MSQLFTFSLLESKKKEMIEMNLFAKQNQIHRLRE